MCLLVEYICVYLLIFRHTYIYMYFWLQVLLYIGNNIQQILNIFDFRCLHHLHGASKHCMHLNILDFCCLFHLHGATGANISCIWITWTSVVCIVAMELANIACLHLNNLDFCCLYISSPWSYIANISCIWVTWTSVVCIVAVKLANIACLHFNNLHI